MSNEVHLQDEWLRSMPGLEPYLVERLAAGVSFLDPRPALLDLHADTDLGRPFTLSSLRPVSNPAQCSTTPLVPVVDLDSESCFYSSTFGIK